jgi:hypothetical protein
MEKAYTHIFSKIPETIDFDFISVKNETIKTLTLENISEKSIFYKIENAEGFIFEPNEGIIPIKKKIEIKIKINPTLATVLIANARIILDQKYTKIIRLSSIAKYPFISINKSNLDFGTVQIGHFTEQELIITNNENVPAKFNIERTSTQPGKQPCMFFISDLSGTIPPKSNYLIKILFKPIFCLNSSYETFTISTIGGNKLNFSCKGYCNSLKTWVGAKSVNFKTVPLGSQIKKLFRIYNESDVSTEFQIYHDNSGVFIFDIIEGIIPAKSNIRINVTFRPYETMVYYQRIFCLIRNHSLFTIDLFGSCHDLLTKTPLLDMKSIEHFRKKQLKGIFFNDINNLNKKKLEFFESMNAIKDNKDFEEKKELIEGLNNDNDIENLNKDKIHHILHKEMFWESGSKTRLISFDNDLIDFNFVQSGVVSEAQILKVTNNSNSDMKVKFIYDKPINLNNLIKSLNIFNSTNTIFFTVPEEQIIPSKSSFEFKVYFKPNKSEFYFYSNMPCQASFISQKEKNKLLIGQKLIKNRQQLNDINKSQLSDFGKEMINQSVVMNQELKSQTQRNKVNKSLEISKILNMNNFNKNNYIDPPFTLNIAMVGHSFPPGTQIFMPMYDLNPKKEIYFPPTSINQSLYQTLKIENKNDTPLFYKIIQDPTNVFRVHNKNGLIPSKSFHLICIEFSPKEATVYRFPLRIIFNHDSESSKTLILNGLCTDPVIDIEGVKNEMYFAPTYVGIKTKKIIKIKNLSPITILVKIKIDTMVNGLLEVEENEFEMGTNLIKNVAFYMTPEKNDEVKAHVSITAERIYNPKEENIGIFRPKILDNKESDNMNDFDKRIFTKEFNILGRGSDGVLEINPKKLEFGTVKVGFHKKMFFSIYNPTITNFYIRLEPDYSGNNPLLEDKGSINSYDKNAPKDMNKYRSDISFDFTEGMLNSFCKKEINVKFEPKTRAAISFKLKVYASDNTSRSKEIISKENNNKINNNVSNSLDILNGDNNNNDINNNKSNEELKCTLEINAKGDYPLIKIVDVRNDLISTSNLWKDLNVDEANEELGKKLTSEEMDYSNAKINKKVDYVNTKLKIVKFDFGKHFLKKEKNDSQKFDIYLALKNEGGVPTEFFFKFPDDVNIKREIWMDPVEPTSNDKVEYHVLKEQIFTLDPRKSKLDPGETTNIRLRYNIKEKGKHRLRVIFQVVNGKPLIFELTGETLSEKFGILTFPKKVINFGKVPIGYKSFISSPIELKNTSAMKIKYIMDYTEVDKFNKLYENFDIIKLENYEGAVGPGETKYIIVYFRALAEVNYKINLTLHYTDENRVFEEIITIMGEGYLPNKKEIIKEKIMDKSNDMPKKMIWNFYNNEMIQKCGFNVEELNFGEINESKNKTIILYNYSNKYALNYDFIEPGFLIKDELKMIPNKGTIDSGKYKLIKIILKPNPLFNSEYKGDILIRITWEKEGNNLLFPLSPKRKSLAPLKDHHKNALQNSASINKIHNVKRENIYLRVIKKGKIVEKFGNLNHKETTQNNTSFIEKILKDLAKQILTSEELKTKLNTQIQEQPLTLYKWTNNKIFPNVANIRQKYLNNLKLIVISQLGDLSTDSRSKKGRSFGELKSTHSKANNSQINSNKQNSSGTKDLQADLPVIKEEFNENTEKEIHEKYLKDLMVKYKYNISDLNEKIIITTEDTKKVICDIIMENTLFNIISESVYGEIDLTVKPRIYFFMGKENEINLKDENLRRSAGLIKNSYNGNLEQNMDNKLIESEMKEEEKVENIIKEETENNKSLGSKNIEKSAVSNN